MIIYNSELYHYGMPRRSGRYKWGSGKDPFHHGADRRKRARAEIRINRRSSKGKNVSRSLAKAQKKYDVLYDVTTGRYEFRDKPGSPPSRSKYEVDVSKAKNSATKRVANDYHNLTDTYFYGKYNITKDRFAKRYNKTDGDTYSAGLKKEARALRFLNAKQGKSIARSTIDVHAHRKIHDLEQKQLDKGRETTAKIINSAMNRYDRKAYSNTFYMSKKNRRKYGF